MVGVLADSKSNIKISIWSETLINEIVELKTYSFQNLVVQHYQGVKLASTTNTSLNNVDEDVTVDWDDIKVKVDVNKLCCPTVSCVKSSTFYLCISLSCRKKVTPYPGETTVTCSNPGCKRKMLVKRCKASYNVDVTFDTDAEQQQSLTIFERTLVNFFNDESITVEQIEDKLLELENVDYTYNNKKVVLEMKKHQL